MSWSKRPGRSRALSMMSGLQRIASTHTTGSSREREREAQTSSRVFIDKPAHRVQAQARDVYAWHPCTPQQGYSPMVALMLGLWPRQGSQDGCR